MTAAQRRAQHRARQRAVDAADEVLARHERCAHCGLRRSDHGQITGGCFIEGRAVTTTFCAVPRLERHDGE